MGLRQWLNSPSGLIFHPRSWWFSLLNWSCKGRVRSGPFANMRYVNESVGSTYTPKLLGTYEVELQECILDLSRRSWEQIIDVGAAEGYYAVGLAMLTDCPVIAFEEDEKGRNLLARMAELNQVETSIEIFGFCDGNNFSNALRRNPECLVIMDVEGFETELLGDAVLPFLLNSTILVEIHESPDREVTNILQKRFERSHRWTEFRSETRSRHDFTGPAWIALLAPGGAWVLSAMEECRGGQMTWLLFEPLPANVN